MKIITKIVPYYEKLVKVFVVNISPAYNDEESHKFRKVYVIEKCVKFSPSIFKNYLCKSKSQGSDKTHSIDKISNELTTGKVKK